MNVDLAAELAALQAVDTSTLTPKQFTAHVARLEKLMTRIESYRLRTLDSFEASGAFDVDAARTPTDWLASQTGTQRRIAGSRMHLVRRLRSMPFTYPAFADGAITEAHVRILARGVANPRTAAAFAVHEPYLVGLARSMSADEFEEEMRRWMETEDPDGTEPSDPLHDTLHISRVGDRVKRGGRSVSASSPTGP